MKIRRYFGFVIICFLFLFTIFLPSGIARAWSYEECLARSGGRGHIASIQQACVWESNNPGDNCALWIGSPNDDKLETIYVSSATGQYPIMYYGSCTQSSNPTRDVWVENDNGSFINPPKQVPRVPFPNANGVPGVVDIALFIQGLTPTAVDGGYMYTRSILVGRCHTGSNSCATYPATFSVVITDGGYTPPPIGPPEEVGANGCLATNGNWVGSANPINTTNNISEVLTMVRNRMAADTSFKKVVYGKLNDRIEWDHCYFPGLQMLASQTIATNHSDTNHPTLTTQNPNTSFTVATDTLKNVAEREVDNRFEIWDSFAGRKSLGDNGYNYIPNFSRVTNLGEYYGGMGIFDNTDRLAIGSVNIVHTLNGWTIGDSNNPFNANNPINWHVGNNYIETSSLPYANHGWIDSHKTWTCTFRTRNQTIMKNHRDACLDTAGYCTVNGAVYGGATSQEACGQVNIGGVRGVWVPDVYVTECDIPNQTCTHGRDVYMFHHKQEGQYIDSAELIIPYNYTFSATIDIDGDYVYAGETAKLKDARISLHTKWNNVTNGNYATDAPYVKTQVVTFVANDAAGKQRITNEREGEEKEFDNGSTSLYPTGNWPHTHPVSAVNVDDETAGKYFCVALKYYPTSSGDDKNWWDKEGDHNWGITDPSCRVIAKRPSFQIWGGNLYSTGQIYTSRAEKNNLAGVAGREYKVYGTNTTNVFGSWDELTVKSVGSVYGLASGGATSDSYRSKDNQAIGFGKLESGNSMIVNKNKLMSSGFCKYESPLTFANVTTKSTVPICGKNNAYVAGHFATSSTTKTDKKELIEDIAGGKTNIDKIESHVVDKQKFALGDNETFALITTATGKEIRYTRMKGTGTIYINASDIPKEFTYIVHSDSTVIINGNITYEGGLGSLNDIPKVIIYAKKIGIKWDVTRVDAALIADDFVQTVANAGPENCPNGCYKPNDGARSVQLRINGTIIANQLYLSRTYGAGTGKYSGVPAEIINYDSTLVLWSRAKADSGETGSFETVYTHELAPRY